MLKRGRRTDARSKIYSTQYPRIEHAPPRWRYWDEPPIVFNTTVSFHALDATTAPGGTDSKQRAPATFTPHYFYNVMFWATFPKHVSINSCVYLRGGRLFTFTGGVRRTSHRTAHITEKFLVSVYTPHKKFIVQLEPYTISANDTSSHISDHLTVTTVCDNGPKLWITHRKKIRHFVSRLYFGTRFKDRTKPP